MVYRIVAGVDMHQHADAFEQQGVVEVPDDRMNSVRISGVDVRGGSTYPGFSRPRGRFPAHMTVISADRSKLLWLMLSTSIECVLSRNCKKNYGFAILVQGITARAHGGGER